MTAGRHNEEVLIADIALNMRRMFPEAARRADVLEGLKRSWPGIVGIKLARHSQPYKLGINELCIQVANHHAESMLRNFKGNIVREMVKRFGYKAGESFQLILTSNIPPAKKLPSPKKTKPIVDVIITDETVRQYMQGAPDTLPEDINYSISHLQAYIAKRFPATLQSHT